MNCELCHTPGAVWERRASWLHRVRDYHVWRCTLGCRGTFLSATPPKEAAE